MGADSLRVAKDAYGYSLYYYGNNADTADYASISGLTPFTTTPAGLSTFRALYNGNIAAVSTNIPKLTDPWHYYTYHYDQLNRVTLSSVYKNSGSTSTAVKDYMERFSFDPNGNIKTASRYMGAATIMDSLAYKYNTSSGRLINNRLNFITDAVTTHNYPYGLDNQAVNNYTYDATGNMLTDVVDTVSNITWTVYGKIQNLTNSKGTISYSYDPAGQRATKTVSGITTYYIRDAQGNTLAVYDNTHSTINWKEQDRYGSSRLGMWLPNIALASGNSVAAWDTTGKTQNELTNYLGNVMVTITDKRIQHTTNGTTVDYFTPDISTAQEYYAFGGLMAGRTYTYSKPFRYGFNGKEDDNDVKGVGNQIDYGMRIYDPRTGKFYSVDPIASSYPMLTSYQFASDRPIDGVDEDGEEWQQIIPQSVWRGSGIYQPGSQDQAREWMWRFIGMYTGALAKTMGYAIGGPEEGVTEVSAGQLIETTPKIIESISEVRVFEMAGSAVTKALKPAEVATEVKKVKSIINLGDLYKSAAKEIDQYMILKSSGQFSKANGVFGNAKGTLFELKSAETLPGVYKVNEEIKVITESEGLVKQQIDLFRRVDGQTFFSQAKSGDYSNTSYATFLKDNLKQIERTILTAGYSNATPEFIFHEGQVSQDIINNLQSIKIKVTTVSN